MEINRILILLLISGLSFACNRETEQTDSSKFSGLWTLHIMEELNPETGVWSEWRDGMQGYILYDDKNSMSVHLTTSGYQDTDLRFPIFTDTISLEALRHLTNSYVYFAKYTVDEKQHVVEHARISHSNPGLWNEIVKRRYTFSGDTLILQPLEEKDAGIRLKWIKEPLPIESDKSNAELIISWNEKIMEMAIEKDGFATVIGVRTEAMMHAAIHDALNAIRPVYTSYSFEGENPIADPIATAAQAAYEVAISQFPENQEELESELYKWLATVDDRDSKTEGIKLGKKAASHIIKTRSSDNWNGEADYTWHPMAPGVYAEFNEHSGTPEGFIFGAGLAAAKPFLLTSQDQFRSPPPPEINSADYTKAYNEVKEYGRYESEVRTEDQAHLAMWWKAFIEDSHNRLARDLVIKEDLNLWESARVFALLNMTIYDAYVSVFENKFYYNHWRPYTAIRWAANDENADTEPDTEWNNLHHHTYPFPSYPSAHGTASTAAMTVLAHTLGTGDEYKFTMVTEEVDKAGLHSGKIKMDPPTRTFSSFSQAGMEASMSRVYLGIHFRYDSEEGYELGAKIGQYMTKNFLIQLDLTE